MTSDPLFQDQAEELRRKFFVPCLGPFEDLEQIRKWICLARKILDKTKFVPYTTFWRHEKSPDEESPNKKNPKLKNSA